MASERGRSTASGPATMTDAGAARQVEPAAKFVFRDGNVQPPDGGQGNSSQRASVLASANGRREADEAATCRPSALRALAMSLSLYCRVVSRFSCGHASKTITAPAQLGCLCDCARSTAPCKRSAFVKRQVEAPNKLLYYFLASWVRSR